MKLEIITPEQNVFNGEVEAITLPGNNGLFQVLKDHAPLVSTLKKGELSYEVTGKRDSVTIEGGVVQVLNNHVLVLAEAIS